MTSRKIWQTFSGTISVWVKSKRLPGIVGGVLERGGFSNAAAKILCWMDGREHADIGGQGWPNWQPNQIVAS